jgi:hypothetical protein
MAYSSPKLVACFDKNVELLVTAVCDVTQRDESC